MTGPLDGTVVVDLTTALSGPYATLLLAGLGATVIKIENPVGGDASRDNSPYVGASGLTQSRDHENDLSVSFLNRGRNKLTVTLDLKQPEAKQVFRDLVRRADVVVENFAPGTAARLGVGYDDAAAVNPRIVYASISGFGSSADSSRKAFDAIIQALSGVMLTSGEEADDPVRFGLPIADMTAPVFAVIGVLSALVERQTSGRGQHVDVSMLGALTSLLAMESFDATSRLGTPVRTGPTLDRLAPFGVFPATDGWVAVCAHTDAFATALFTAMHLPELAADDRFATRDARVRNGDALHDVVANWTRTRSSDAIVEQLERAGVPAAPVRDPLAALRDPDVVRRGEVVPLVDPTHGDTGLVGSGIPLHFSRSRVALDRPSGHLGEHNSDVYQEWLGYDDERMAELRAARVI